MDRLKGKVAIITGGAKGIGAASTALFAQQGAKVIIADIDQTAGQKKAQELTDQGYPVQFFPLDVTDEEAWQALFKHASQTWQGADILINNAGISLGKNIEETSLEEWDNIMKVNGTGVFLGTKYAIAHMKTLKRPASIVNRSSIDGQVGEAGLAAYCASKGAVTLLTKSAALHCGQAGYQIRVNSVHPGYVRTSLTEQEARDSQMDPQAYFEEVAKSHPIGYIGKPMDIAHADLFLASDESIFMTGSEVTVDGGWTAQ